MAKITQKAIAAIERYVMIKTGRKTGFGEDVIKFILEADKLDRDELYAFLDQRGYAWRMDAGEWQDKKWTR